MEAMVWIPNTKKINLYSGFEHAMLYIWTELPPRQHVVISKTNSYSQCIEQLVEFYWKEYMPYLLRKNRVPVQ